MIHAKLLKSFRIRYTAYMNTPIKIGVTFAVLTTILINLLANLVPYNNVTTAEISDRFNVYFVPAGYVFSIWGLIYVGLLAVVVGIWKSNVNITHTLKQYSLWLMINLAANSGWLFLWHYGYLGTSVLVMLVILISLIMMSELLWKERANLTLSQRRLLVYPTSLYLGWICAATVANITDYLYSVGWNGYPLNGITWACTMLVIVAVIAWLELRLRRNWIIPFVVSWTSVGIAVKFWSVGTLATIALVVAVLMVVAVALQGLTTSKQPAQ